MRNDCDTRHLLFHPRLVQQRQGFASLADRTGLRGEAEKRRERLSAMFRRPVDVQSSKCFCGRERTIACMLEPFVNLLRGRATQPHMYTHCFSIPSLIYAYIYSIYPCIYMYIYINVYIRISIYPVCLCICIYIYTCISPAF